MNNKKQIAIVFGGISVEHDVSIITAIQIYENIDRDLFNPIALYITKRGEWYTGDVLFDIEKHKNNTVLKKARKIMITADKSTKQNFLKKIDVVFPANHGSYGEDGSLQGLLEFNDIPYVGSGVTGSACGMDKIIMKYLFMGAGLSVLDFTWFFKKEWNENKENVINIIETKLNYPIVVKPACSGSSIGVSFVQNKDDLEYAINIASKYGNRILAEKGIKNPVEVNCSCLGYQQKLELSALEEPIRWEEFLSYENKYMHNGKTQGMKGMKRKIPPDIDDELIEEIKSITLKAFKIMDLSGLVRIDYLLATALDHETDQ